ncbi:MAG TPA: M67 family metallopeptidase [Acidimicrobiales bacterium]|nr:M67 family metallopeptidase [Acidimicrobiales bacterium]
MLQISADAHAEMVAHCWAGLPLEACGLLAGTGDHATRCYPTANVAESAVVYTVDPKGFLRADRDAESQGLAILGVFHSHTHTAAYPSPTDVAQAPDPGWHYVLVSLAEGAPVVRSYRIIDGNIDEEPVVLVQ